MRAPAISVVIPAHNAARYIVAAIDSALAQTLRDLEIVVVDDGSTDETPALAEGHGPPVRVVQQANAGVAAARNRGIEESRGRYVAFLDADDVWLPAKLDLQMAALARPGCGVAYSAFVEVREDLEPILVRLNPRRGTLLEDLLLVGNVVGTPSTVICERELLQRAGGFDPAMSLCADWDLWVRLAHLTDFAFIEEPLVRYRRHGANMSRDLALLERESLRVLEKGFAHPDLATPLRRRQRSAFAHAYMVLAGSYYQGGRYGDFLRCLLRSLFLDLREGCHAVAYPLRALERRRRGR